MYKCVKYMDEVYAGKGALPAGYGMAAPMSGYSGPMSATSMGHSRGFGKISDGGSYQGTIDARLKDAKSFQLSPQDIEKLYGIVPNNIGYVQAHMSRPDTTYSALMSVMQMIAQPLYSGPPLYGPDGMTSPNFICDGGKNAGNNHPGKGNSNTGAGKGGSGLGASGGGK